MRRLAEKKVDAIKVVHQGGCRHGAPYFMKIDALGVNVQILRLDRAVLEAIIDEAHKHGLKATVHTVDEEAAIEALEAGANGLEHGILEDEMSGDRVIELLLRNERVVRADSLVTRDRRETSRSQVWQSQADRRRGRASCAGHGQLLRLRQFWRKHHCRSGTFGSGGIAPQKVLEMATKNAGVHLGNDALGTIAPGRIADLIIVDGDPTTKIGDLRNVAMVIKDGKIRLDKMREALRDCRTLRRRRHVRCVAASYRSLGEASKRRKV